MNKNSDAANQFGFGTSKTADKQEANVSLPVEEHDKEQAETNSEATHDDVDEEYTDIRKVTVVLVKNYSLYRKANDKVLPKRKDFIGSSVHASRVLSSNKEEVDTYFPNIIGLSPSDPNFIMRVKQYLNNIRIPVDELGRSFDTSFHYYHKKDYYLLEFSAIKLSSS